MEPIELSTSQEFELEQFSRAIEAETDLERLRELAKMLLSAWMDQRQAAVWVIQQMGRL